MASPDVAVGTKPEFRAYHALHKKDGKVTTEPMPEPFGPSRYSNATNTDSSYALVIKRTFTKESPYEPKSVTLTVNSSFLLQAFRDVIRSYPTVASDFLSPFDLESPFQMLMHYWEELKTYGEETDNSDMRIHLGLLFQFMFHELGAHRQTLLSMLQKKQVTFSTAWALFRPGTLLYTKVLHYPWVLVCKKTAYEQNKSIGPYLEVHATYTDFNGTDVGEATHIIRIAQKQQFGGDSPAFITDLPIYPRRYLEDEGLDAQLEERGRKFLRFQEMSVEAYDGIAQYKKEPPYSYYHWEMESFSDIWLPYTECGRVVVDRKTFQNDFYKSVGSMRKVRNPSLNTCPPYVFGFSLSRKLWCRFFLDNLDPVEWIDNAWDSLILEKKQKSVIQALITSHTYPDNPRNQPEQKGKGLVVLLHGTPGCGKTLTAELAAEAQKTALIIASLGELNRENSAIMFERELQRFMQYATIWKAVLLLDEADVFLEKREDNPGSAERNALVAVFLKQLEYFSGIVFLTTNRLRTFDAAMSSRVHLALGYKAPDIETRRQLWVQCLSKLPAEEIDFDDVDDVSMNFVDQKLNGREISNAVNTARTMARFEGKKLQTRHIDQVLSLRAGFQEDLKAEGRKHTWPAGGANVLRRTGSIIDEVDEYAS
ncbi:Cell division cycle protein 48-like protein [Colletotrichum fructicola]|nr:Cell division cycle protein 48-like protein [Colletotrichum fructicola]KAF5490774.1 Cell division cycle protein 48-like protein [Colletotrichum fructicola]